MSDARGTKASCSCSSCVAACENKPGWMKPEDLSLLAKFLNKPEKRVFKRHLVVDWWERADSHGGDIFVLAPGIMGIDTGDMMTYNPKGTYIFFKEGRCAIHAAKPFECRELFCGEPMYKGKETHRAAAMSWDNMTSQKLIVDFLGHAPLAREPHSLAESMGLGF